MPRPGPVSQGDTQEERLKMSKLLLLLVALLGVTVGGCGTMRATSDNPNDPFESVNRRIFATNLMIKKWISEPLSTAYHKTMPDPLQQGLRDFLANGNEPMNFANDLLQGEFGRAWTTTERMALNTTLGIGGFTNWAGEHGYERESQECGTTVGKYGVDPGPYLVFPLTGPTDPRDAMANAACGYLNPVARINPWFNRGRALFQLLDGSGRKKTDDIERDSIDLYEATRGNFWARRDREIADVPEPLHTADNHE